MTPTNLIQRLEAASDPVQLALSPEAVRALLEAGCAVVAFLKARQLIGDKT